MRYWILSNVSNVPFDTEMSDAFLVCHFKVYELFGIGTLSIYVPIQNTRLTNIIKTYCGNTKRVNKSIHYFFRRCRFNFMYS